MTARGADILTDGSRHRVFNQFLTAETVAKELGGTTLLKGCWVVAAHVRLGTPRSVSHPTHLSSADPAI